MTHVVVDAGYALFEHTADIGMKAWGAAPGQAFAEAVRGMFAIILGADPEEWQGGVQVQSIDVEAGGEDWQELLVNWLVEFLYRFEADAFIPRRVSVRECLPPWCAGSADGTLVSGIDEVAGVAVKAVTYHLIRVDVTAGRTDLQVIFDI